MAETRFLTVDEVAKIYSVTEETVRNWAATGEIPGKKIGKYWYFDPKDILKLEKDNDVLG